MYEAKILQDESCQPNFWNHLLLYLATLLSRLPSLGTSSGKQGEWLSVSRHRPAHVSRLRSKHPSSRREGSALNV